MVRKVKVLFVFALLLVQICAFGTTAQAQTYTPYEGNISTSNLVYFEDTLSKVSLLKDYVLVRSGQYDYVLIVGDLEYSNNKFIGNGECDVYKYSTTGNYNSYYTWSKSTDNSVIVNTNSMIIYSNLGDYPELESRGDKFEVLQTIILIIMCLSCVIGAIFGTRKC